MRILASGIGKEYIRIFKNDNGYIQDFFIEVVSKESLFDLRDEKKNELQPLFVGEVDLAGISVLYKRLESYVPNFYTVYDKFNSGGQVLHQVRNIPNLEVGFFNTAKAVDDLSKSLLNDLKNAKSTISAFTFIDNKKGIMINHNALEFKILKEGTSYIYNSHKDYHHYTSYRTRYTHSVKKKRRWPKKTTWEAHYRVDVEWYIAYARDKFVDIPNLLWKYEELQVYLEKMRIFIELERMIAELEKRKGRNTK